MPIISINNLDSSRYYADVCIIGAGPAGITLALELDGMGIRVALLEEGNHVPQSGENGIAGIVSPNDMFAGLTSGRVRSFGGTSRVWGAQCLRLSREDFIERPWVPNSGWPITYDEIEPYYRRAEKTLNIDFSKPANTIWRRNGVDVPDFHAERLIPHYSCFSSTADFSSIFGRRLETSKNITVFLDACVTEFTSTPGDRLIQSVCVKRIDQCSVDIYSKIFVLAAGGIENARILLNADLLKQMHLDQTRNMLGKYFQEHPTGKFAEISTDNPLFLQRIFSMRYDKDRRKYWPKIQLSFSHQEKFRTLNCNANLRYDYDDQTTKAALERVFTAIKSAKSGLKVSRDVADQALAAPVAIKDVLKWFTVVDLLGAAPIILREAFRFVVLRQAPAFKPSGIWLQLHLEQAPNPLSRVYLSEKIDRFGRRSAIVDWRLGALELLTANCATEVIRSEFARLNLGVVTPMPESKREEAYHHMGTTRMAATSFSGVVDPECRCFDIQNLFVAGSSVFPTSGFANPTLTIVALAIRLADRIKAIIQ